MTPHPTKPEVLSAVLEMKVVLQKDLFGWMACGSISVLRIFYNSKESYACRTNSEENPQLGGEGLPGEKERRMSVIGQ